MTKNSPKKVVPWFGSNTKLAPLIGEMFGPLRWAGVPFCGGCAEMKHIEAKIGVANDLYGRAINLYRVIANPLLLDELINRLVAQPYHSACLKEAQDSCEYQATGKTPVERAVDYFTTAWMGRKGGAGTNAAFRGALAVRWTSDGGDPVMEYNNAVEALSFWHSLFRTWAFLSIDAFVFIDKVKDQRGHGLYIDAPWPEVGNGYTFGFDEDDHTRLALALRRFKKTKVLIRFGDHPLIRKLYPESKWRWRVMDSKNQGHKTISDVLISNWDANAYGRQD